MCVSLLERVKQGKSNIILILILSARSQDRDMQPLYDGNHGTISIHSVARPRRRFILPISIARKFQSTRSQDRDISSNSSLSDLIYFNPLGRKTETRHFDDIWESTQISIRSVARPRLTKPFSNSTSMYFNPLGRKTETKIFPPIITSRIFQSARSQDRDKHSHVHINAIIIISIRSVARPRHCFSFVCLFCVVFQSARSQDRDEDWLSNVMSAIPYFNPLGRKTETRQLPPEDTRNRHFNPLGRKTETK